MRDHNKAFCRLVSETFGCAGPVYEFGALQVEGQEAYADLRHFFPGRAYVGCDMRKGPGVDRLEDVSAMTLERETAGTVLCIETFEHVFEVRRAFDEVFRVLKPGGVFVMTSPLNFRIHGYPDDYWRMTPSCLRRMLTPYGARLVGWQGHESFPHTVMALGIKAPAPADFERRSIELAEKYAAEQLRCRRAMPMSRRFRRMVAMWHRSRGERHQIADYFKASFVIDAPGASQGIAA
jgi:SAM-dependent methyltransferase